MVSMRTIAAAWSQRTITAVLGIFMICEQAVRCQDHSLADPEGLIAPQQQLLLEQVSELLSAGMYPEALDQMNRLSGLPSAMVPTGPIQVASTQRLQAFRSLQNWCSENQRLALAGSPELNENFQSRIGPLAEMTYQSLQRSKDAVKGIEWVAQYGEADAGTSLVLLLSDILLEGARPMAAMQVLEDRFPELTRVELSQVVGQSPRLNVPWYRAWQTAHSNGAVSDRLLSLWNEEASRQPTMFSEIVSRQLVAAAMQPQHLDLDGLVQWAKVVASQTREPALKQKLQSTIDSAVDWAALNRRKSSADFRLDQWPEWQVQLERFSNSYDLTPASHPRVGQLDAMLPSIPLLVDGKVFLHELTRIRAFVLDSGKPWPLADSERPLFDSQISPATYLPLGYPTMGFPRGSLTIVDGCLYARMGTPVSAWANRIRSSDGNSISYLVGLDLESQGRMLQGFPRHILSSELEDAEFDGCPVVCGEKLIATLTQRDHGNIRRRLAAFDRFSGRLLWLSPVLGSGAIAGSHRTNLISNAQPIEVGGLIYFASDLGTVACLNSLTGQVVWLSSYQRIVKQATEMPRPSRFRYRDGTSCCIHRGLVYCLPQDSPELFAVDAFSGDLVWATNEAEVADCSHMVGFDGQSLIVSGDSIVWLDGVSGRLLRRFPTFTTPGTVNSLPQPRGLGRAALVEGKVFWPTSGEVYVFAADQSEGETDGKQQWDSPVELARFVLGSRGAEGGNLVAQDGWLVYAAPGRLFCYRAE